MNVPAHPSAVRKQIKSGATDAIYLLQGEDDVEKSGLAHEFEELVEEGLRAFNVDRIHAGDLTTGDQLAAGVASLVAAVRTLPMMSPRRVVLVLQADAMLAPKRDSEAAARALDRSEVDAGSGRSLRRRSCSLPARSTGAAPCSSCWRSRRRSSNAE